MDSLIVLAAFACGFAARQLGQAPMVGYLVAGFGLGMAGFESSAGIEFFADAGIAMMLFIIGLKLNVRDLLQPQVYRSTFEHGLCFGLLALSLLLFAAALGLPLVSAISWQQASLLAFALSFSSTVCAVSILEERGEFRVRHGQIAVGILIVQDIVAVLFLTASTDAMPSPWALLLLLFARPLLGFVLRASGHDEVLILAGIILTFGGGALFEAVDMKADLGALVLGILLSGDRKAAELAKSMISFKDIFLIGFFLNIGLSVSPSAQMLWVALLLCLLLPLKGGMFFLLLTRKHLRARTSILASLALAQYSEFGLIVAALALEMGWLSEDWLATLAIAVAISFVLSNLVNDRSHILYGNFRDTLKRFETDLASQDSPDCLARNVDVLVVGMGRVG